MKRDDLDPLTRAVSDALDDLLLRHHGIASSWANPETFIEALAEDGYMIIRKPQVKPRGRA